MTAPVKSQHRAQQSIAQMPVHPMRTRQPHRPSRDREGVETAPKGFSGIGSECSLKTENTAQGAMHLALRRCCISGTRALAALLRFRPVRPARSAWHEMPGHAFARRRRPARAALGWTPPCDGWSAWGVAGRWSICGCRECVLVAAAYVPASMRMRTRARRSQATERGRWRGEAKSWPDRPQSQGLQR